MFYSNFMVMSFPFITMIEYNEKGKKNKRADTKPANIGSVCPEKRHNVTVGHEECKKNNNDSDINLRDKERCDMAFLSNLEDFVFYTSSSNCLMRELSRETKTKNPIEYDKYLEFFE